MNIIGIIPAKYESIRFPHKNFKDINGKKMIVNTIEKMMMAGIDTIIVSTDAPCLSFKTIYEEMVEKATYKIDSNYIRNSYIIHDKKLKPSIYIIERERELCHKDTPTEDVIINIIKQLGIEDDYMIALCQLTSPNWSSHKLRYAIYKAHDNKKCDRFISVSPDFKPNGCFYLFSKNSFIEQPNIYTEKTYLVTIPWDESTDINYYYEWCIANSIAKGNYDR